MRVAIVHHSLATLGGGERVCVSFINGLNKVGITPDLYTLFHVSKNRLENFYGKRCDVNIKHILRFQLPLFGMYQRLVVSFSSFMLTDYDVIVNTSGVYAPLFMQNLLKKYFLYVYNPVFIDVPKYEEKVFWKIYSAPYKAIVKRSLKKLNAKLLLVSEFTRMRVKKWWGRDGVVVYPPVDVEKFSQVWDNRDRDGVITIGRFTPEKGHLMQLKIAEKMPDITFRICGSAKTPYYQRWFNYIRGKAEEMDLRNVEFYPSVPFKKLLQLIGESKVFLHTFAREDFGLTTCETITGGCIPVVPDEGGSVEIVFFKKLRFNNVEEAVKKLRYAHDMSPTESSRIRDKLKKHVWQFREENFQRKMLEEIRIGLEKKMDSR